LTRRRWQYFLLAATICLAIAGTALAATSYKSGSYKGTTGQTNPKTHKKYGMSFKIANGKISNVSTKTRDKCPNGKYLVVRQNAFTSASLDSKGRFTLRAGSAQQPAVMKGKVTGSTASGTITDKSDDTFGGSGICKASTTWTAKIPKKKK
jgi:hypothetical protein